MDATRAPKGAQVQIEQQAFRIDVCGHQYSLPAEQPDAATLDGQLQMLAQPFSQALCGLAVDLTPVVADAMEKHIEQATSAAAARRRRRSVGTRRRSLRKRESLLTTLAMSERQQLAASFRQLCGAEQSAEGPLDMLCDVLALLAQELRDAMPDATSCSTSEAARQLARVFAKATAPVNGSRRRSTEDGVVEFSAAPALLDGDGATRTDAADSLVGVCTTREDAAQPFTTGLVEYLIAGMNRHARQRPDVRHAWGLIVAPGSVRWCLMESDAIHVTSEVDLGTRDGRRSLAAVYVGLCLSEAWRLGADPSMRWRAEIERWAIECPTDVCDPRDGDGAGDAARSGRRLRRSARLTSAPVLPERPASITVYAPRAPLFVADSFFGRFTRCFAAARTPESTNFDLVLKDSWQLLPDNGEQAPEDEIQVLDHVRARMDAAQADAVYPRILCGGTVRIATGAAAAARDTSQLVLDDLDAYTRWTVPHGFYARAATAPTAPPLRRLHRRMASGPVGTPLQALRSEHEVVAVLADAMQSHAEILRHAGVLHRDVSLNNVMAVRSGTHGPLRGMLIDFDHAVDATATRNTRTPGNVGTGPFMSIANLEGLDVPRTAADDWEALICLLFCLAAKSSAARDEMGRIFAHVSANGVADIKREMFASLRALDSAIDRFLNPSYTLLIRLIRALHDATFMLPRCQGTTQISLRGNRLVDPVQRRVQYAEEIQDRCLAAMRAAVLEVSSMSSLSDAVAAISHACCDLRRQQGQQEKEKPLLQRPEQKPQSQLDLPLKANESPLLPCRSAEKLRSSQPCSARSVAESDADKTLLDGSAENSVCRAAETSRESVDSLSTLLADDVSAAAPPRSSKRARPNSLPHPYNRSTSDTLSDVRTAHSALKLPVADYTKQQLRILVREEEAAAIRKRKSDANDQEDSPRTKRRKMIHESPEPLSYDSSCAHYVPLSADSITPARSHRQLAFSTRPAPAVTASPTPLPSHPSMELPPLHMSPLSHRKRYLS
ncbi:hypothetical protein COEREDRAFT_11326 [Coemansia reversa NRRL 1564]|uniref:Fungal-type protein kinase domain-containing protein n=1 Tax=Coemansia reversa (strain ATCC 12441 / NRRL 1564) TaxID=763665 RepID=A0A2G5B3G4_COERN|nr:hypothetical protein COEREDRAFT_11326 [Coemansia reversa NRRL 1564]|eukprot:PIA13559.1 hypothetical protein COEREDRAFT_11326 [Coemansia reversa NRRL 1564]